VSSEPPESADADALDAAFDQGLELHRAGRLDEAERIYRSILQQDPDDAATRCVLAMIALQTGRVAWALELAEGAVAIDAERPEAHHTRGLVLRQMQRTEAAAESFSQAVTLKPDYVEAHYHYGSALQALGRLGDAVTSYDRAIALQPDDPALHSKRGRALVALGRYAEATAAFDSEIALRPDDALAHYNRALSLHAQLRFDEALASYDAAIGLQADFMQAYNNRSALLRELQRLDEALASADTVIALSPDLAGAYNNRGAILLDLGRSEDALADFDRALSLNPDYAEALCNRGFVLRLLRPGDEAVRCFEAALRLQPDYAVGHENYAMALLQLGDFQRGWSEYEWRWQAPTLAPARRPFPQPLWLGEQPIAGATILLHAEQGMGDTLQFCRLALDVAARGAQVVLEVQQPLVRLLASLGTGKVIAQGEPLPHFDLHCPLLSLPLALRTRVETIPAYPSYLHADPFAAAAWHRRLWAVPGRRVGLVWSGAARQQSADVIAANRRRSMTLAQFTPLGGVPGVSFVSLQKGPPEAEARVASPPLRLFDATDELHDFADTAALIAALDLVIAVDTSVAHLAGALGKPVWILNRFDSCWRWLLHRTDSPWYPTARLFRQPAPGDWDSVIAAVCAALRAWVG